MSEGHQIFIARLPRDTRAEDIEAVFKRYGPMRRCDVRSGGVHCYAFVVYEDRRDAEDAIKEEDGRDFRGNRMAVEWARGNSDRRGGGYDRGGRSRRSPPRRGRSRSYSPRDRRRRSPSYSPKRRRSISRSPRRSRSLSRSRSRSRS